MDTDWKKALERWLAPFVNVLGHPARRKMCPAYIAGLIGPGDRIPRLPQANRCQGAARSRYPYHHGQLRHPQDRAGQGMAGTAPPLSRPFHADISIMDQSSRALVCRTHPQAIAPRCSHFHRSTRTRYRHLHRAAQPEPKAIPLDQIRR